MGALDAIEDDLFVRQSALTQRVLNMCKKMFAHKIDRAVGRQARGGCRTGAGTRRRSTSRR
jgi:hypothetical protein